jgi:hypothetical protein
MLCVCGDMRKALTSLPHPCCSCCCCCRLPDQGGGGGPQQSDHTCELPQPHGPARLHQAPTHSTAGSPAAHHPDYTCTVILSWLPYTAAPLRVQVCVIVLGTSTSSMAGHTRP